MSAKARKDKDSILADTKNLLKILLPAIQRMPKIERHDGVAQEMKVAALSLVSHFTTAFNCPEVREQYIHLLLFRCPMKRKVMRYLCYQSSGKDWQRKIYDLMKRSSIANQ